MLNTMVGSQGGYLVDGPAKLRQLAVMVVSHLLVDALYRRRDSGTGSWGLALKLPANCSVVAVSEHHAFRYNATTLLLECPDFVETPEGACLNEVHAEYGVTEDLLGKRVPYFAGWYAPIIGPKVTIREYVPPLRPDTSRCSEELGHFERTDAEGQMGYRRTCYCGRMVYDEVDYEWGWHDHGLVGDERRALAWPCSAVSHFRDQDDRSRCQCGKMACVDGHWRELKVELLKAMACPSAGQDVCDCPRVEDVARPAEVADVAKPEEPKRSNRGYEFL